MCLLKIFIFLFFASSAFYNVLGRVETTTELQTYIIHVQSPEGTTFSTTKAREAWYRSFLPDTVSRSGDRRVVHYYHAAMTGFAAKLTKEEVKAIESMEGFLQAYPDKHIPLLTTHTPQFLGLSYGKGLWENAHEGEGVIIGVIDSGITPHHPSFSDNAMPPPPAKWKGVCNLPPSACNNKLIGARNFMALANGTIPKSPVDINGHGTHTSSTAAGSFVKNVAVLGNANGTASGIAPRAHLAMYKVGDHKLVTSDIVAGMDSAISDGVDIMSLSLGIPPAKFYADPLVIAAFGAIEKGIFVTFAAGNDGPGSETVANGAPWVLTVAASTTDRTIRSTVMLGNGQKINGQALYQPSNFPSKHQFPLVLPENCTSLTLKKVNVTGKMVLCLDVGVNTAIDTGTLIKAAGGAAMIFMNCEFCGYTTFAHPYDLPASSISYTDGVNIKDYVNSTRNPTATIIFEGTKIDNWLPAPAVAYFSSRGPNMPSLGILKPDIIGPGVDVLAAWPFSTGTQSTTTGTHISNFNVMSGTSVSAPHLSRVVALLKNMHRDWSPAAIKSAIMTTSDVVGNDGTPIKNELMKPTSFFLMGAGHVNASRAIDPGLVYDIDSGDYLPYLCGLGYTDNQVSVIVKQKFRCVEVKKVAEWDLNYPSIVVRAQSKVVTIKRTVTNIGGDNKTYVAELEGLDQLGVKVSPRKMKFEKVNEKKMFTVQFTMSGEMIEGEIIEGYLKWISGAHVVRSPILVITPSKN